MKVRVYPLQFTKPELKALTDLLESDDCPPLGGKLAAAYMKLKDATEKSTDVSKLLRAMATVLDSEPELAKKLAFAPNPSAVLRSMADVEDAMQTCAV